MTAAELLFDLLLVAVVAYCLARVNLQAVRYDRSQLEAWATAHKAGA